MTVTTALPFFTIGHSNRGIEEFIELLRGPDIESIIDVRKIPMSRANPQFNEDALPQALAPWRIAYEHVAALGGLRAKTASLSGDINGFWNNRSFHNYADYALGDAFTGAFAELVRLGAGRRPALMCSEALWWRCHRRIIADYLLLNGHAVDHLMAPDHIVPATPTPGAQRTGQGKVVYPAPATTA